MPKKQGIELEGYDEKPVSPDRYDEEWLLSIGGYQSFVESRGNNLRPRLRKSLELADISAGTSILDIGCGRGETVLWAAMRGGRRSVGIDYSRDSLHTAKKTVALASGEIGQRIGLYLADAKALPFATASFDRILMNDIVEHLHNWELNDCLQEIRRVLRDDGYVVIHTLPNRWTLDWSYKLIRLFVRRLPPEPRDRYAKTMHINEQSLISLEKLLRSNGFACKIWLENIFIEHARWSIKEERGIAKKGAAGKAYTLLQNPMWSKAYCMLSQTPMKLLLVSDIYGIAWKSNGSTPHVLAKLPAARLERFCTFLARLI